MEVIYRKIADIHPLPDNPRTIGPEDLERLKESIRNNPDYLEAHPLVLSDRTGELIVIDGNQRLRACLEMGMKEVPTALLSGLTEEREQEIIIRANVLNGKWDEMILKDKWDVEELKDWGVDLPADWDTSEAEEQKEAEEDDFSDEDAEKAEPRVKPVEIVANCMMDASVEGDIVLDMFGGSGTTIIAAEQLGRRARLMELDPHYCDVIIARWEKLTGKEAVKVYG